MDAGGMGSGVAHILWRRQAIGCGMAGFRKKIPPRNLCLGAGREGDPGRTMNARGYLSFLRNRFMVSSAI